MIVIDDFDKLASMTLQAAFWALLKSNEMYIFTFPSLIQISLQNVYRSKL